MLILLNFTLHAFYYHYSVYFIKQYKGSLQIRKDGNLPSFARTPPQKKMEIKLIRKINLRKDGKISIFSYLKASLIFTVSLQFLLKLNI